MNPTKSRVTSPGQVFLSIRPLHALHFSVFGHPAAPLCHSLSGPSWKRSRRAHTVFGYAETSRRRLSMVGTRRLLPKLIGGKAITHLWFVNRYIGWLTEEIALLVVMLRVAMRVSYTEIANCRASRMSSPLPACRSRRVHRQPRQVPSGARARDGTAEQGSNRAEQIRQGGMESSGVFDVKLSPMHSNLVGECVVQLLRVLVQSHTHARKLRVVPGSCCQHRPRG